MTASDRTGIAYLDSSAVVKLIVGEPESHSLADHLETCDGDSLVTSALTRIEVSRAVRRQVGDSEDQQIAAVLSAIGIISIDAEVIHLAERLQPPTLRSLDALHIATAKTIGAPVAFITYDTRCAAAATANGLAVLAPS